MDPNQFHIDWERLGEVLTTIVVLSFFVERALALVFENRHFVARFKDKGIKEPIAYGVSPLTCRQWDHHGNRIIATSAEELLSDVRMGRVVFRPGPTDVGQRCAHGTRLPSCSA